MLVAGLAMCGSLILLCLCEDKVPKCQGPKTKEEVPGWNYFATTKTKHANWHLWFVLPSGSFSLTFSIPLSTGVMAQ